jgi:hypothetical protein
MSVRNFPAPLWFLAALVPMVVSQIIRLKQSDPATWIAWDYAGRVGALAVLGAIPSVRTVAFHWERLRTTYWEAGSWIVGIVLVDHYVCGWIRRTINGALPATVLGGYPEPRGWLHSARAPPAGVGNGRLRRPVRGPVRHRARLPRQHGLSTWSSASRLLPTARRSCSAAVRVTCSRFT